MSPRCRTDSLADDGLWKRPEGSPRDCSIVTVAALITRIQTIEMPFYFALALDNGVKPSELSEIIIHLAFYSGWANAMSAVEQQSKKVRPRPQWEFGFPILRQCPYVHRSMKEFRITCLATVEAHDVPDGHSMGISTQNLNL
jgi:hypothetical protein